MLFDHHLEGACAGQSRQRWKSDWKASKSLHVNMHLHAINTLIVRRSVLFHVLFLTFPYRMQGADAGHGRHHWKTAVMVCAAAMYMSFCLYLMGDDIYALWRLVLRLAFDEQEVHFCCVASVHWWV